MKLGCVVEGHGEVEALPILLRRLVAEIAPHAQVEIPKPIRQPRGSLINKPGELERAVGLAALRARPKGAVLIVIDSEGDCPAQLAPALHRRAEAASMGLPVGVVLPQREFEAWFLAAAESLRGVRGLPPGLARPVDPERINGAKEWLKSRMATHSYSETIDQPAIASRFDLQQARSAPSFEKCCR